MRRAVPGGLLVAGGIVALGAGLGTLAVVGKPRVVRRPDPVERPVLLLPDFDNRTGRSELVAFTRELSDAVRERLEAEPAGIFEVSPRRLRPVLGPGEREDGLLRIAGRLGADYVLVGSLESGPGDSFPSDAVWPPPLSGSGEESVRLDVLLVRDSEPPDVFAERFPLGAAAANDAERERLSRWVADRIALSLRRP